MSTGAIVMGILSGAVLWGGCAFCVWISIKKHRI